jgi:hypothetical protein
MIKNFLLTVTLLSGAVLISIAYQSWEVGFGVAAFVLFSKIK